MTTPTAAWPDTLPPSATSAGNTVDGANTGEQDGLPGRTDFDAAVKARPLPAREAVSGRV